MKIQGLLFMTLVLLPSAVLGQLYNNPQFVQEEQETVYPRWAAKTNLLYDAAILTLNLGVEFKVGHKTTLDIPVNYNDWVRNKSIFSHTDGNTTHKVMWKNFLIQPEFRYWTKQPFGGHFLGLHGHYAFYNVGGLWHPPFSKYMHDHRFEGWLAGAGLSYGYRYNFKRKLHLEATLGVGYAYLSYDIYPCADCSGKIGEGLKSYFGPTKLGLNLIYGIGTKSASKSVRADVAQTRAQARAQAQAQAQASRPERQTRRQTAPPPPPPPVVTSQVVTGVADAVTATPTIVYNIVVESERAQTAYQPQLAASYMVPEVETIKARSESGKAYLDYEVGRSDILPYFRSNSMELQRIHSKIREVVHDPDATITGIVITGYASPEGSYANNMMLSQRRALSLKDHLRAVYGFHEGMFMVWGAGEDWAGLDSLVSHSFMPDKYRVLSVIHSAENYDMKELRLRRMGGYTYQMIRAEFYPKLRRSDYRINYTVKPFTVDKAKEVMETRPVNLSLNEIYLIADSYQPGSDAFNKIFELAVGLFPDSDEANINAAANALDRGDAESAALYLSKVKNQNVFYWNNMGVLLWMQGDKQEAASCFARGGTQGALNAAELLKHVQSVLK